MRFRVTTLFTAAALAFVASTSAHAQAAPAKKEATKAAQSAKKADSSAKVAKTAEKNAVAAEKKTEAAAKKAAPTTAKKEGTTKKAPSSEPLNTDSVLRLVKANFSDGFILDLLSRRPSQFSTDTNRIVELKQAGVSERLLSLMVSQSATDQFI